MARSPIFFNILCQSVFMNQAPFVGSLDSATPSLLSSLQDDCPIRASALLQAFQAGVSTNSEIKQGTCISSRACPSLSSSRFFLPPANSRSFLPHPTAPPVHNNTDTASNRSTKPQNVRQRDVSTPVNISPRARHEILSYQRFLDLLMHEYLTYLRWLDMSILVLYADQGSPNVPAFSPQKRKQRLEEKVGHDDDDTALPHKSAEELNTVKNSARIDSDAACRNPKHRKEESVVMTCARSASSNIVRSSPLQVASSPSFSLASTSSLSFVRTCQAQVSHRSTSTVVSAPSSSARVSANDYSLSSSLVVSDNTGRWDAESRQQRRERREKERLAKKEQGKQQTYSCLSNQGQSKHVDTMYSSFPSASSCLSTSSHLTAALNHSHEGEDAHAFSNSVKTLIDGLYVSRISRASE